MTGARLLLPADGAEPDLFGHRAGRVIPQGAIVVRNSDGGAGQALLVSFSFSTDGLGLVPGNPLNLIQAPEMPEECERLGAWFDAPFATEVDDTALACYGLSSIDSTTRLAQKQFNRWLELDEAERTPFRLVDRLNFDYFTLLDRLTIVHSLHHSQKQYGDRETSRFPECLTLINVKPDVDLAGEFPLIHEINSEIRCLNFAAYAPLRYVLPQRREAYDEKYSTGLCGGGGTFRKLDREESPV